MYNIQGIPFKKSLMSIFWLFFIKKNYKNIMSIVPLVMIIKLYFRTTHFWVFNQLVLTVYRKKTIEQQIISLK